MRAATANRRLWWLAGTLAGLVAIYAAAVWGFAHSDLATRLEHRISRQLAAELGRPVAIGGLRAGLAGVDLVRLSLPAQKPGDAALEVDDLHVGLSWWRLLWHPGAPLRAVTSLKLTGADVVLGRPVAPATAGRGAGTWVGGLGGLQALAGLRLSAVDVNVQRPDGSLLAGPFSAQAVVADDGSLSLAAAAPAGALPLADLGPVSLNAVVQRAGQAAKVAGRLQSTRLFGAEGLKLGGALTDAGPRLTLHAERLKVSALTAAASGQVGLDAEFTGDWRHPELHAASSGALVVAGHALHDVQLAADGGLDGIQVVHSAKLDHGRINGDLTWRPAGGEQAPGSPTGGLSGTLYWHGVDPLSLFFNRPPVAPEGQLDWSYQDGAWKLSSENSPLGGAPLAVTWHPEGDGAMAATLTVGGSEIDARVDQQLHVTAHVLRLEQLVPFFPALKGWSGPITAQIALVPQGTGWSGSVEARSPQLLHNEATLDDVKLSATVTPDGLDVKQASAMLGRRRIDIRGHMPIPDDAESFLDLLHDKLQPARTAWWNAFANVAYAAGGGLDLTVEVPSGPLDDLAPWVPQIGILAGTGQATLHITGSLSEPQITGNAVIDGGRFRLPGALGQLGAVHGRLTFTGNGVRVDSLDAAYGTGRLHASGQLALATDGPLKLQVDAQSITLPLAGVSGAFTGRAQITGSFLHPAVAGHFTADAVAYGDLRLERPAIDFQLGEDLRLTLKGTGLLLGRPLDFEAGAHPAPAWRLDRFAAGYQGGTLQLTAGEELLLTAKGLPWELAQLFGLAGVTGTFDAGAEIAPSGDGWSGDVRLDSDQLALASGEAAADLHLTADVTPSGLTLEQGSATFGGHSASGSGTAPLPPGLDAAIRRLLGLSAPAKASPALPLALHVASGDGPLADLAGFVPAIGIEAGRLAAELDITGDWAQPVLAGDATIESGRLELGALGAPIDGVGATITLADRRLAVRDLHAEYAGGTLTGEARVDVAPGGQPTVELKLNGRRIVPAQIHQALVRYDEPLDAALDAVYQAGALTLRTFTADGDALHLAAGGRIALGGALDLDWQASGLPLPVADGPVVNGSGRVQGSVDDLTLTATLAGPALVDGPLTVKARALRGPQERYRLAEAHLNYADGSLSLKGDGRQLTLDGQGVPVQLVGLAVPSLAGWSGKVDAHSALVRGADGWSGDVQLNAPHLEREQVVVTDLVVDGALAGQSLILKSASLTMSKRAVKVSGSIPIPPWLETALDTVSGRGANESSEGAAQQDGATSSPLHLLVDVPAGPLRDLGVWVPGLKVVAGTGWGHAEIDGARGVLAVTGELHIRDGDLMIPGEGRLSALDVDAALAGDHIELKKLKGAYGGGDFSGSGTIQLASAPHINIAATLRHVTLPIGFVTLTGSGPLRLNGPLSRPTLSGKVEIESGMARLGALGGGGGPSLPDLNFDLYATVDSIEITGYGIYTAAYGTFHLGGSLSDPKPSGLLETRSGSLDYLGTLFQIEEGQAEFRPSGGWIPFLDVTATTHLDDGTATLQLTGAADALDSRFTSDPPRSEREILESLGIPHLISGIGRLNGGEIGDVVGTSLQAELVGNVASVLRRALNVDDLSIDPNNAGSVELALGKRVGDRLYISYSTLFGKERASKLGGTLKLLQNVELSASVDSNHKQTLGIDYTFHF